VVNIVITSGNSYQTKILGQLFKPLSVLNEVSNLIASNVRKMVERLNFVSRLCILYSDPNSSFVSKTNLS
jgi:hypothetical protein